MAQWWHYLVAIPAALLLVNGIPHFVKGITGEKFPTPFVGGPPSQDTAVRNVIWGGGNLLVGALLLWFIRAGLNTWPLRIELIVLALAAAIALAWGFSNQERFGRGRKKVAE